MYKIANFDLEEFDLAGLPDIPNGTIFIIASDAVGDKKILKLNPHNLHDKQTLISSPAGLCLKLIGGSYQWVPC